MSADNDPRYSHTYYLENVIRVDRLRETVAKVVRALKGHVFDSIAFRGASGLLIAPAVAMAMNKELIMVRKPEDAEGPDATHSSHRVEGFKACKRYVILDDMVSSGRTGRVIVESVSAFALESKCVGLLEYMFISDKQLDNYEGKPFPLKVYNLNRYSWWETTQFVDAPIPYPVGQKPPALESDAKDTPVKLVKRPVIGFNIRYVSSIDSTGQEWRKPVPVTVRGPWSLPVDFDPAKDEPIAVQTVSVDFSAAEERVRQLLVERSSPLVTDP